MYSSCTKSVAWAAIALSFLTRVASPDGLIFQLPAEGVWASYEEQVTMDFAVSINDQPERPAATQSKEQTRNLTVKSLDRFDWYGQACRWIEIGSAPVSADAPSSKVLKLLIPEKYLRRGEDPLSHSIRTFFSPKGVDQNAGRIVSHIEEGFNRVQYEIDRVRVAFPKPLEGTVTQPSETLKLHGREWPDCEIITGRGHYDGPLSNHGRWVFDAEYRIALHPDAPFGLVSMDVICDSTEYTKRAVLRAKLTERITLAEVGQGAVSELQQHGDSVVPPPTDADDLREVPQSDGSSTGPEIEIAQMQELEQIMHAKDGAAMREFVLLGGKAPNFQKSLDKLVREVEAGDFAEVRVIAERSSREGPFLRVIGRLEGHATIPPGSQPFLFLQREGRWRLFHFFGGDLLDDAKTVLSEEEWQALLRM